MFAVPNWAVKASSLAPGTLVSSKDKSAQKSKKRKREADSDEPSVRPTYTPAQAPEGLSKPAHSSKNQKGLSSARPVEEKKKLKQPFGNSRETGIQPIQRSTVQSTRNVVKSASHNEKLGKAARWEGRLSTDNVVRTSHTAIGALSAALPQAPVQLTALQAKMRSKLTSARFRHLNETLYTSSSADAFAMFANSPDLFADYHAGFSQQVRDAWPQNPVDGYVHAVKTRGLISSADRASLPLPRRKTGSCTIADLGCGDAPLARGCQAGIKSLQLRFYNYDLQTPNTLVTKADIANLPLRDGEVDIAVFCLSLMGTNWVNFVEEAWRVLRGDGKGEVWVAEVKSRFGRVVKGRVVDNSVGKRKKAPRRNVPIGDGEGIEPQFAEEETDGQVVDDETDVTAFIKVFTRRGFQLREGSVDKKNKMFVSMVFTKSGIPTAGKHKGLKWNGKAYTKLQDAKPRFAGGRLEAEEPTPDEEGKVLKPCVYKVR